MMRCKFRMDDKGCSRKLASTRTAQEELRTLMGELSLRILIEGVPCDGACFERSGIFEEGDRTEDDTSRRRR